MGKLITMSRRDLYMILAGVALVIALTGAAWGVVYLMGEEKCFIYVGNPRTLMQTYCG